MPDSRAAALDFMRAPHKTLFTLSVPVLFSLIAEPVTGLVDTAFVARLGAEPLAALGVGTMLLSAVFWIFNFLGVGTQTEVAQALGRDDRPGAARMGTLALGLGGACGLGLALVAIPLAPWLAKAMGGQGDVALFSEQYIRYRLLGGPAVILTMAAFGVLRGAQDMRTPMWVACGVNLLNIGLDWLLIFGAGPFPAMGVAGAALASSLSQWAGAVAVAVQVVRKTGFDTTLRFRDCRRLLAIGWDMFLRTGMATLFLLMCTRAATRAGAATGAAHQAIRQVFVFTVLFLDCFAITGQSLVGYFVGKRDMEQVFKAARTVCLWSFGTGVMLCLCMLLGQNAVAVALVPEEAWPLFFSGWTVAAVLQPINSLSFATDGIHWGTGDFTFLRNVMILAASAGMIGVWAGEWMKMANPMIWIWAMTGVWCTVRAVFGMARIWPGIGKSPFRGEK